MDGTIFQSRLSSISSLSSLEDNDDDAEGQSGGGTTINQDAYNHRESQPCTALLCLMMMMMMMIMIMVRVMIMMRMMMMVVIMNNIVLCHRLCGNETSKWYYGCSYRTEVIYNKKYYKIQKYHDIKNITAAHLELRRGDFTELLLIKKNA